jgi:hypothetical protein
LRLFETDFVVDTFHTMKKLSLLCFLMLTMLGFAQAQYFGGYLRYTEIGNNQIAVHLRTYTDSAYAADHCFAVVELWNSTGTVVIARNTMIRQNGLLGLCDSLVGSGESLGFGIVRNDYAGEFTLPSNGFYLLQFRDSIYSLEIGNQAPNYPIHFTTLIHVNPYYSLGGSPQIMNDSVLHYCDGDVFFDPHWIDADGDSLSFFLSTVPGVAGYDFPAYSPNAFEVDMATGVIHLRDIPHSGWLSFSVECLQYRGGYYLGTTRMISSLFVPDSCLVTATESAVAPSGLKLFPNPATSSFQIQLPEHIPVCNVRILDVVGRLVIPESDYVSGPIEIGNLPAGLYEVVVQAKGVTQVFKLLKR